MRAITLRPTSRIDLTGSALSAVFSRSTSYAKLAIYVFDARSKLVARRARYSTGYAKVCDFLYTVIDVRVVESGVRWGLQPRLLALKLVTRSRRRTFGSLMQTLCLPVVCGAVEVIRRKRPSKCCNRMYRLGSIAVTLLAPGRCLSLSEPVF